MPSTALIPRPPSNRAAEDVEQTRRRIRAMEGQWEKDLAEALRYRKGVEVANAWGRVTPAGCALRELSEAVSVLYVEEPAVRHPDAPEALVAAFLERLRISSLWSVLSEAQVLTEALNEMAVLPDLRDGRITYSLVTPDVLDGTENPRDPSQPIRFIEWKQRRNHVDQKAGATWYADVYDLSGAEPVFYIMDGTYREVQYPGVTDGERLEGDRYPWRRANSDPYIPASLRHSKRHAQSLFYPWFRSETMGASYEIALRDAAAGQVVLNIAWPYGYAVDVEPVGYQAVKDAAGNEVARQVLAVPGSMLQWRTTEEGRTGQVGVLDMRADVVALETALGMFVSRVGASWGISGDDLWKTDARSGAAITLSEGARRRLQRQRAPIYRPHDERLLGMIANLLRTQEPDQFGDLPDTGWRIEYQVSPLSPQERAAIREEADALLQQGVISLAEYRSRITGEDLATATQAIARIRAENQPNAGDRPDTRVAGFGSRGPGSNAIPTTP